MLVEMTRKLLFFLTALFRLELTLSPAVSDQYLMLTL